MPDAIIPIPQVPVSVREATLADVPFIDRLQKMHSKMVGFMPTGQLEGKIRAGDVLVAEEVGSSKLVVGSEEAIATALPTTNQQPPTTPLGYVIGTDRYFKHDDVGIIYQLNVAPGKQRSFVGATLLRAMFDRAAYGCKLFCCWCAQDIEANRFWESMGFVPLAFRAGSEKRARVHIFWQKRIRAGDTTTPWWFPAKTDAGAMREDRLVLPIPPGLHWSDEMPVIRPDASAAAPALPDQTTGKRASREKGGPPVPMLPKAKARFGAPPSASVVGVVEHVTTDPKPAKAKPPRVKKKAGPKLVAAARELRDRWLEQVNAGAYAFEDAGKYEVTRLLPERPATSVTPIPALSAPIAA